MAAAGAWTYTNAYREHVAKGTYGDQTAASAFTAILLDSTSNIGPTSDLYSALTGELATANGYTQNTLAVTLTGAVVSTSGYALSPSADITWDATGGNLTARYCALIHKATGYIFAYVLLDATPADVTAVAGNPLTVKATNPVVTEQ